MLIRELLNNNVKHLAFIGEEVLGLAMRRIAELAQPLMQAEDAGLVGYSVLSLVIGQFTLAPVRGYVSGDRSVNWTPGRLRNMSPSCCCWAYAAVDRGFAGLNASAGGNVIV